MIKAFGSFNGLFDSAVDLTKRNKRLKPSNSDLLS